MADTIPSDDDLTAEFLRSTAAPPVAAPSNDALTQEYMAHQSQLANDPDAQNRAFGSNFVNTALFNIPRNVAAGLKTAQQYVTGDNPKSFTENYNDIRDADQEAQAAHPVASAFGTGAGIIAPMAVTMGGASAPAAGSFISGLAGNAVKGAGIGAGTSALSEYADSKDPYKAAGAGVVGAAVGGVAAPIAQLVGSGIGRLVGKSGPLAPSLAPDAVAEIKAAGLDPANLPGTMLNDILARGGSGQAARDQIARQSGVTLTQGQSAKNFTQVQSEQNMARAGNFYGKDANQIALNGLDKQGRALDTAQANVASTLGQGANTQPMDSAANLIGAVRSSHATAQNNITKLYSDAFANPTAFDGSFFGQNLGNRIADRLSTSTEPLLVHPGLHPASQASIDLLNNPNFIKAGPNGAVDLTGVDTARKILSSNYASTAQNPADRIRLTGIINQFDNTLDHAAQSAGNTDTIDKLKAARSAYSNMRNTFYATNPGDSTLVQKIVEQPNILPEDVAKVLYPASGSSANAARATSDLAGIVQPGDLAAHKSAIFNNATRGDSGAIYGPQKVADRIDGLASSSLGQHFDPAEIAAMKSYGNTSALTAPPTINGASAFTRPDTAGSLASMFGAVKSHLGAGGGGAGAAYLALHGAPIEAGAAAAGGLLVDHIANKLTGMAARNAYAGLAKPLGYNAGLLGPGVASGDAGDTIYRGLLGGH